MCRHCCSSLRIQRMQPQNCSRMKKRASNHAASSLVIAIGLTMFSAVRIIPISGFGYTLPFVSSTLRCITASPMIPSGDGDSNTVPNDSEPNNGDDPDTTSSGTSASQEKKKRSFYDLGSSQNKPLSHLRQNMMENGEEDNKDDEAMLGEPSYQIRELSEVEFWGAGYINETASALGGRQRPKTEASDDDKSVGQKKKEAATRSRSSETSSKRYDLGMGKNSPLLYGGSKTSKLLLRRDEEGELYRAVGSGGEGSLSGLSRVDNSSNDDIDNGVSNSWGDFEQVSKGSGLVGAHIDDPFLKANKDAEIEKKDAVDENRHILVDDEAITAAASAYVNKLLHEHDMADDEDAVCDDRSAPSRQSIRFEDIDLSVPPSVFDQENGIDLVWDLMRYEALVEAEKEPILVSFLHSTILNHATLESALAFHLANKLSAPAMIATQIMTLIKEALDASPTFRRTLRADILAVRDRDPACTCLPDVFLYFKGFHSLQSYRVAHHLWKTGRHTLAHYLQSQVSQTFQIDIHPNATLGTGLMMDHGTGVVIGESARIGHNVSILHHVTLGGSGKKHTDRHPKVGDGVLLGAGCSALGNIRIGDGCQVGAGTLVIEDLPPRSVAVGVPAKIIGTFVDVSTQPARNMNQLGSKESDEMIITFETENI